MMILGNLLALTLIGADGPPTPPSNAVPLPTTAKPRTGGNENPDEAFPMTLREAIRIGLRNSPAVRVVAEGDPFVIAPAVASGSRCDFRAAVMAHVRSIEQQYWALANQQVALGSRETAVRLGGEIFRRELAELESGRSSRSNVAEVEQQVENFKLNLVSATSDVITTERQLRNILGLPVVDGRRIVPATAPVEAKIEPEWEASLASMQASHPDIRQQLEMMGEVELRRREPAANPAPGTSQGPAAVIAPSTDGVIDRELERHRAFLRQVVHQATHTLARFFLEVDANYKQFRTAQRLRAAAQQRFDAQLAFYQEGRITIDRLLDAVSQHANAIAQEAQYQASYNASIVALEEAKGTLLDHDGIAVVDHGGPSKGREVKDDRVAPAAFEKPPEAPDAARSSSKTFKLKARIGPGLLDVDIEVRDGAPAAAPGR